MSVQANALKNTKNETNRKSYEKQKIKIARVRILKRIANGSNVDDKTINDPKYEWTDEEKRILETGRKDNTSLYYVEQRSEEFIKEFSPNISLLSKGNYELLFEDVTSQSYLITKKQTENLMLSLKDCVKDFDKFVNIEKKILKNENKGDIQRKLIITTYTNRLQMLLDIYGTDNVLELYRNPERLHNKLLTSHLSIASVKDYVSVLITLYKFNADVALSDGTLSNLLEVIHKGQIYEKKKLRAFVKSGICLSKNNEEYRRNIDSYYSWDDIKKLPIMLSMLPDTNLKNLRDKVIVNFYIRESVLRDNLGSVKVIYKNDPRRNALLNDVKTNVLDLQTGILTIKDFKTNDSHVPLPIHVSKETIDLVKNYLDLTKTKTKIKPDYLITKNDGTMYLNGKLSGYIRDMFNKYTGVHDFSINTLRHSVATFHRSNSPIRIRNFLSRLLQHTERQHIQYTRSSEQVDTLPLVEHFKETEPAKIHKYLGERCAVILNKEVYLGEIVLSDGQDTYRVLFYDKEIKEANNNITFNNIPNNNPVIVLM